MVKKLVKRTLSWNNTLEPSFSIMAKNNTYQEWQFLYCYIAIIEKSVFKEGLLLHSVSQPYCCTFRQSNSGQVKKCFLWKKRIIRNWAVELPTFRIKVGSKLNSFQLFDLCNQRNAVYISFGTLQIYSM